MAAPLTRRGTPEHSERVKRERKASWARIKAGEGFIYVAEIVGSDIVKIGFALNPKRRIADSAGFHNWGKRRLLAFTPGTHAAEVALHKKLRAHRIKGETYPRSILTHEAIPAALRQAAA